MLSSLKLLNKGLETTSISILLEKKILNDPRRLFIKSAPKSAKKFSILYLKNYSTIQELPNYLIIKKNHYNIL